MANSRKGIGTGGKVAVVVVAVLVIAAGLVYADPGLFRGSSSPPGQVVNVGATGSNPTYALVQAFSKATVSVSENDVTNQFSQNLTVAYTVIGTGTINGTQYTKVEFVTVGQQHNVIAWYSHTGQLGEVDVPGIRNYIGNGTVNLPYIATYDSYFGAFAQVTNNATLLSHLVESTSVSTSVGGMKAQVTTYVLGSPTPQLKDIVVKYATFSATNLRLAVYIHEMTPDGSSETLQITSLTR